MTLNKTTALSGLYALTDTELMPDDETMIRLVTEAIDGGVRILQYRDKSGDDEKRFRQATQLQTLCQARGVVFLINDDAKLAKACGAFGVHLGQSDGAVPEARALLGDAAIIGVTCHDQLSLAETALRQSADYVAFGAFFPSKTKPNAKPAPMSIIQEAKARFQCPVVAIGGITVDNAPQLIDQGVDMIAVVHSLFSAENVQQRAEAFARSF